MPNATTRTVIWDFDGTLGARNGGWWSACAETIAVHAPEVLCVADDFLPHLNQGYPWHTPDIAHTHFRGADDWWDALHPIFSYAFARVGVPAPQCESLAKHVRGIYCDPARFRLLPGALATLARFADAGWTQVLLTNHVPELPAILKALGIVRHFFAVINSADIGHEKPHPEIFAAVHAIVPDNSIVWMVGDNPVADIDGARRAGIPALLVHTPEPGQTTSRTLSEIADLLLGESDAAYDSIADWYDDRVRSAALAGHATLDTLWPMLGDIAGLRVLDLCCGQGFLTREMARRGANALGIDRSELLLAIALRDETVDPTGARFAPGDARTLTSLPDSSLDRVVCHLALMDIDDLDAVFRTVHRALSPGGRFVAAITHPCFQAPPEHGYFFDGYWRSSNPDGVRGKVGAWHRPLSRYLNAASAAGLVLDVVDEPVAPDRDMPLALLLRWRKAP